MILLQEISKYGIFGQKLKAANYLTIFSIISLIPLCISNVVLASELEQIVVTATLNEKTLLMTPASVTHLNTLELDRKGFQFGSDELRGQTGVFFRRGGGDNDDFLIISFRGVEGNHGHGSENFLGLVDGIPYIGGDEEVLISEVPYDAVEEIEIVRGPMSALYGRGGISGTINYRLKEPDTNSNTIRVMFGEDDYYKATVQNSYIINDQHSVMASVAYSESDGWRENNQRESTNVFLRSKSELSDYLTLDVYANFLNKNYESGSAIPTTVGGGILLTKGGDSGFIGSRDDLGKKTDLAMLTARLHYEINDTLSMHYSLHNRRIDTEFKYDFLNTNGVNTVDSSFAVQGFESEGVTDAWYTDFQIRWKTDKHQLITGLNFEKVMLNEKDYWTGQFFGGNFFSEIRINYLTGNIINSSHPGFFQRAQTNDADTTIDASWSDFKIPSVAGTIDLTGKVPTGIPEHMAAFQIDYRVTTQLHTHLAYEYYADYYYTQNNSLKGGGFDVWNLSINYAVKDIDGLSINFSATNLLDNNYYYRFGDLSNSTYVTAGVPRQLRMSMAYNF